MAMSASCRRGFAPYALAAFLIGIVGGFSAVLGPAFVQDIGIAYNNTTWTALSQAISTAALAPALGKLSDVLGRRNALLLGIGVFALGNLLTALADSLWFMMAARFIVGAGTAAIAPVIVAYIATEFPRESVAKGFALYMLISSSAVVIGPTLGGMMIAAYGWRSMIWLCVGICAVVLGACGVLLRTERNTARTHLKGFDGAGAALSLVFFGLMLCVPSFGQNFGWRSGNFAAVAIAAVISLTALVLVERRAANPVLPAEFIARRTFVLSAAALFLTQGLMQANMTNLIIFINHAQPESAMLAGYAISVMYVGMSLGAILLGPLADRREPRTLLTGSLILTGLGCALQLTFGETASALRMMASLGLLGVGLGGNGTILMRVALSGLNDRVAGAAAGTYGLFRDLSAPFGVAVFVPLFSNGITARMAAGAGAAEAAVASVQTLGIAELACVAAGVAVVRMLPKIHRKKEELA